MLDCIMKKGREVFLNTNEFQHLGLPEVWSQPPVSSPSVWDLHMSEADEWRLGPPTSSQGPEESGLLGRLPTSKRGHLAKSLCTSPISRCCLEFPLTASPFSL